MSVFILSTSAAHSESIDYGALENLFGEPVTTSVTGSSQRASDVPASMIIVTQDEIRRSGARDLPGVLSHVPSVGVLQWTNDAADVAIRGYNQAFSPRLLVLINGRQVYADDYGYTPWSTLPVELGAIRQIEIVMGPNSALFGFNAVGGVINIVTYDPLYDDKNTGYVMIGTQGTVQGSAVATFRLAEDAGVSVTVGGRKNDDFSTPQRPLDVGSRLGDNRKAVDVLGHAVFQGIDANIEVSHSESAEVAIIPDYTALFLNYQTNSLKGSLSADTELGNIQATAYGNWLQSTTVAPDPSAPIYPIHNRVYVVQLRDLFKIGTAHIFRLSAEYRHNEMETTPLQGATVSYDIVSAGAMWNWAIQPNLSLTNAIRLDYLTLGRSGLIPPGYGLTNADWNNTTLTAVSFNTGVVWQGDEDNTVRLTSARGVLLPNLTDLGGLLSPIPPFGYASGIPTLKPTAVLNFELDWNRKIQALNGLVRLRAFHQTSQDIVANVGSSQLALGLVATPANIGKSRATGLELMLEGTISGGWRWGLSYTAESIVDRFAPGFSVATIGVDYEHTNPVHVADIHLGWAEGRWDVDSFVRYQSKFDSIAPSSRFFFSGLLVRVPGHISADARVAYHVNDQLTIALSGQNLLQSPQIQTSAAAVERRVLLTASLDL